MKITKLKSESEEEKIGLIVSYAILVHKSHMKDVSGLVKDIQIPSYLKRIKSINDWVYVLCNSHNHKSLSQYDTIKVNIPHKQACTQEQYIQYREIWPCIFHKKKEEPIDSSYVMKWVKRLLEISVLSSYCTGGCLIVGNDTLLSCTTDTDDILGHSIFSGVDLVSGSQIGYLCTGFDAFIINEPCLSCAMVFVHGRIKRVFCINKRTDGSFSKLRFNFNKGVNHRYDVYFIDF